MEHPKWLNSSTNTNNLDMEGRINYAKESKVVDKEPPASIENIYLRLSHCYHNIFNIRLKLEFILEGKGDYPNDNQDYPVQSDPSMPTIKQLAFDIEQQINLCNQLVNVLKDGGHLK